MPVDLSLPNPPPVQVRFVLTVESERPSSEYPDHDRLAR
ncbi:MAG: hypothetical protein JWR37_482 [Mycobacterium sp.]|nr:hypothetical protein [Mycobacterium sp.]